MICRKIPVICVSVIVGIGVIAAFFLLKGKIFPDVEKETGAAETKNEQIWVLSEISIYDTDQDLANGGLGDSIFYVRDYENGIITLGFEDTDSAVKGIFTATVPEKVYELEGVASLNLKCIEHEGISDANLISTYTNEYDPRTISWSHSDWAGSLNTDGVSIIENPVNLKMKPSLKDRTEKGIVLSVYYDPSDEKGESICIGCSFVYQLIDSDRADRIAIDPEEALQKLKYNSMGQGAADNVAAEEPDEKNEQTQIVDIDEKDETENTETAEETKENDTKESEDSTNVFATEERPARKEFSWYEEVRTKGFWDAARPVIKTEDILGGWKGCMKFEGDLEYLVNVDIAVEGEQGIVTLDWYQMYSDGEVYDISDERDSVFVGAYSNQEFYVTGAGSISFYAFYEYQGKQYSIGRIMMPSGEEADLCLVRP